MNKKNEFCIMDNNYPMWANYRFTNSHKHHIMGGAYRKKSDEDGLVIFLTPELHNMSNQGIHFNKWFDNYAKKEAQKKWMEYYNKTVDDWVARYGHNYLGDDEI